jgi:antitoxin component YwqK of YwqJK toxin-antitoxin module
MKNTILILIVTLLSASAVFAGSDTVVVAKYDTGVVKTETTMKDGVRDGASRYYDTNGKLVYEISYKGGVFNDTATYYYDSGKLYDMTVYKDGTFIERNIYNEDGTLAYKSTIELGKCVERDSTNKVIYSKDKASDKYCK